MRVSRLGGDYSDAEAVQAVQFQFGRLIPPLDEATIRKMIRYYRQYKLDGMSDAWILKEMRAKRSIIGGVVATPGGVYPVLTDAQISNFVTALQRLSKGDMPYNPWEKPTWEEAYASSLGKLPGLPSTLAEIPWGKIALVVGGGVLLYGFVNGMGRGVGSR